MIKCIVPMTSESHKGSSGRVGVLGGSARYTGAPYYASMASLKVGADLAYVFCAEEAAMAIKCYSPELMVSPVYCAKDFDAVADQLEEGWEGKNKMIDSLVEPMVTEVVSMMNRMHVLVIGCGLGRCPVVFEATARIIQHAMKQQLTMVLDADALYLLTVPRYRGILSDYSNVVLTPNVMEYKRLVGAQKDSEVSIIPKEAIVVKKGRYDEIQSGDRVLVCEEEGGLKRSGGLGDILAGTLGTFSAWSQILSTKEDPIDLQLACWSACCVVKQATKHAFEKKRRAMTAPDVLEEIGPTFDSMTTSSKL